MVLFVFLEGLLYDYTGLFDKFGQLFRILFLLGLGAFVLVETRQEDGGYALE